MLRVIIEDYLEKVGIEAEVCQYCLAEISSVKITADVILATTDIPPEIKEYCRVIDGMALLNGIGADQVYEELEKLLKEQ
jgi:galactitol-specific phosphotransferase system IIB component